MNFRLPHLSAATWTLLCLGLSAHGSILFVLLFAIVGGPSPFEPYFAAGILEALLYLIGFSLLINLLGAGVIYSLSSMRKRRTD